MPVIFRGGPNIPTKLLNLMDDREVVFFCGAGISVSTGLPDFAELTQKIWNHFKPSEEEKWAKRYATQEKRGEVDYSRVLGELESEIRREHLRKKITEFLNVPPIGALDLHKALLTLAETEDGGHRLVTTNFDDRFTRAAEKSRISVNTHEAPTLPPIENHGLRSVVYLHGRIKSKESSPSMVLTTADFGRAYLTERWASRFLAELLRCYHVLFVGYGLNDPIIRYVVDAVADVKPQNPDAYKDVYALACDDGKEKEVREKWEHKNVKPILYQKGRGKHKHRLLNKTITTLAEMRKRPIEFRRRIVMTETVHIPIGKNDEFAQRVLWALKKQSVAEHFANGKIFDSGDVLVAWLNIFRDEELLSWDPKKHKLVKHLDFYFPPDLIGDFIQLICRHLHFSQTLVWVIENQPVYPALKRNIAAILWHKTTPPISSQLKELWVIFLLDNFSPDYHFEYSLDFIEEANQDSSKIKELVREKILSCLQPRLVLTTGNRGYISVLSDKNGASNVGNLMIDVCLSITKWAGNGKYHLLRHFRRNPDFKANHAREITACLTTAAKWMEKWNIEDIYDIRCFTREEDDSPRDDQKDWIFLALLARDSFLDLVKNNKLKEGKDLVKSWAHLNYPIFRRLSLFALAEKREATVTLADIGVRILLNTNEVLWSIRYMRECRRFLRKRGDDISPALLQKLQKLIHQGPPRCIFREDISDEDYKNETEKERADLLAKLELSGAVLSDDSQKILEAARLKYPKNEFERTYEFTYGKAVAHYMGPDKSAILKLEQISDEELPDKIIALQTDDHMIYDDEVVREFCKKNPKRSLAAFEILHQRKFHNLEKWQGFLQNSDAYKELPPEYSHRMLALLADLPNNTFNNIPDRNSIARILESICKVVSLNEIRTVWWRIWNLDVSINRDRIGRDNEEKFDFVAMAINHPHGILSNIVLHYLYGKSPTEWQEVEPFLNGIIAGELSEHVLGRMMLGRHLPILFKANSKWSEKYLLPLFSPESDCVIGIWQCYLWVPYLYSELAYRLKDPFLHILGRISDFGKFGRTAVELFTLSCIKIPDLFSIDERKKTVKNFSEEGLLWLSQYVLRMLRESGGGEESAQIWREVLYPFMDEIWPYSEDKKTSEISATFARILLETGNAFPDAWEWIRLRCGKVESINDALVFVLHDDEKKTKMDIILKYPKEFLQFLDHITKPEINSWERDDLRRILQKIKDALPETEELPEFNALMDRKTTAG